MLITYEKVGRVTIATMPENIVYANAEAVRNQLYCMVDEGFKYITLDLSSVAFIDSSGLAVLVAVFKRAEELSSNVSLMSPNDNARMLLELTRLHQVFDIYENKTALVEHINAA